MHNKFLKSLDFCIAKCYNIYRDKGNPLWKYHSFNVLSIMKVRLFFMLHLIYCEDNCMNYLAVVNYVTDRYIIIAHDFTVDEMFEYKEKFIDADVNLGMDMFLSTCTVEDKGYWEKSLLPNMVSICVLV